MAEVTIVGGGIIGLSIADELARSGAKVRLLDRAGFGTEASWAGAGMLPPGNLDFATTPEARLRGLSHRLWPNLVAWLQAQTGVDSGYRMSGAVHLFERVEQRDAALAAWRAESIPAELLSSTELAELEPALDDRLGPALHLPGQAQVRNPRHLKALIASCRAQGVELVANATALGWEFEGDRATGVRTTEGVFHSDRYCIAAGAWSRAVTEPLGLDLDIRPVRGQIVLLNAAPRPVSRMVEAGSRYLVPRPDGRVLVGATQEEAGFDKRNTASAVLDLIAMAIGLCPSLGEASVERTWSGLRPGSPDGLPYLGRVPDYDNVFVAAGHFRSGLQMSPGTARIMRQILLDEPVEISPDGFSPTRHSMAGTY